MRIAENIKWLRRSKGMGGHELAEQLGVSQSTISGYERGTREPSLATVIAICDFFHIDAHTLLTAELDTLKQHSTDQVAFEPLVEYGKPESSGLWDIRKLIEEVESLKQIVEPLKSKQS